MSTSSHIWQPVVLLIHFRTTSPLGRLAQALQYSGIPLESAVADAHSEPAMNNYQRIH
jgi:hypothetical protein